MSPVISRVERAGFAVAVLCSVVACAAGPAKTETQQQADKKIAEAVQAALDADKNIYAKHIFVRADNGVVRLTGYVWEPPELIEATQVAGEVAGVTRVVNDLELQHGGSDSGVVR